MNINWHNPPVLCEKCGVEVEIQEISFRGDGMVRFFGICNKCGLTAEKDRTMDDIRDYCSAKDATSEEKILPLASRMVQ